MGKQQHSQWEEAVATQTENFLRTLGLDEELNGIGRMRFKKRMEKLEGLVLANVSRPRHELDHRVTGVKPDVQRRVSNKPEVRVKGERRTVLVEEDRRGADSAAPDPYLIHLDRWNVVGHFPAEWQVTYSGESKYFTLPDGTKITGALAATAHLIEHCPDMWEATKTGDYLAMERAVREKYGVTVGGKGGGGGGAGCSGGLFAKQIPLHTATDVFSTDSDDSEDSDMVSPSPLPPAQDTDEMIASAESKRQKPPDATSHLQEKTTEPVDDCAGFRPGDRVRVVDDEYALSPVQNQYAGRECEVKNTHST
jgi:hypothetical protein